MATQPNVLVIMSDEHAPMFSGLHDHPVVRTPHLDRLAADGAVFDNAYCNSPLCAPSRMSFLTGQYVHHTRAWDNTTPLRSDIVTWPYQLRSIGYDVALSGKQHFIGPDQRHGFQAQLARDLHAEWQHRHHEWADGAGEARREWQEPLRAGPGGGEHIEVDDQVERAAVTYLRDPARAARPWALCVSFLAPHFPFVAPQEYWDRYRDSDIDMPALVGERPALHPVLERMRQAYGLSDYTEDQVRRSRHGYYALISYLDDKVGRLIDVLDDIGQADNTMVIYTSDHGEMAGEHGLWRKSNFYEQSVRVPLVMRWPSRIAPRQRRAEVVSLVDVSATIGEACHAPSPGSGDGASLLRLVGNGHNATEPWSDTAFSEYLAHGVERPMAMLRERNLKLIYYHGEHPELFDLEVDPGETCDLSNDPAYAEQLQQLQCTLLSRWDPDLIEQQVRNSQAERALVLGAGGWGAVDGAPMHEIETQFDRITGQLSR